MALSKRWNDLFPYEDVVRVVGCIQQTWDGLVTRNIPRFNPSSKEPHLTQFLHSVLKTEKTNYGLTGHFSAEESSADPDLKTGKLKNRGRTDIRYFSDRINIDLTFEFKKLEASSSSCRSYYNDGMLRFVNGKYSQDYPLGFMVGLIADEPERCMNVLKDAISSPKATAKLRLVPDLNGAHIKEPSLLLNNAGFDTEHSRTTSNIILCHVFLLYGNAGNPPKKRTTH